MRDRTMDCFKCKDQQEVLYRCRFAELKDWVLLCGQCLKEVKSYLRTLTNMVALGRVRRNKLFYAVQQFNDLLQHLSLQQHQLYLPVL